MGDGPSPEAPRLVCGSAALVFGPPVWTCHRLVFGDDFADYDAWYSDLFAKHAKSPGHRLVLTQEDHSITGYAWGTPVNVASTGRICCATPFQSRSPLTGLAATSTSSNSQFSPHRRRGLGQALHDCLLEGVTRRCLLGTSTDPDDPAVRLYTHSGWRTLGTLRTGMQVMGLDRT